MKGVKGSDIPAKALGKTQSDGTRERALAQGVGDSDISVLLSGMTCGGVVKDILGIGKGKREGAPAQGVMDLDSPSKLSGTH